jgi:hypothetical protein
MGMARSKHAPATSSFQTTAARNGYSTGFRNLFKSRTAMTVDLMKFQARIAAVRFSRTGEYPAIGDEYGIVRAWGTQRNSGETFSNKLN